VSETIEARFTTVLNTNERLKRELSAAKAEIARLRTAMERLAAPRECGCSPPCRCNEPDALLLEIEERTEIALAALAALKPDTGEPPRPDVETMLVEGAIHITAGASDMEVRLYGALEAAQAEIARLREWKTAAENLIAAIRLDSGIAYPWPALDIADAALKPDTGELVDYVEFTDGTSLIGEEATAFFNRKLP
jgi:hypothetical protein